MISMDVPPSNDLKPPNLPRIDTAATSSAKAIPIDVKPRPISSQDIDENDLTASDKITQASAKAIIAMLVEIETLLPFKIFIPATNSASPIPIAVNPRATSLHDKEASSPIASAIILIAPAIAIKPTDPFKDILFKSVALKNNDSSVSIPPIPSNPFPIPPKSNLAKSVMADVNIAIAPAIAIVDNPALNIPFESNLLRDLVKDRKLRFNSVIRIPTAVTDFAMSVTFNLERLFREADNIPTATEIVKSDDTFIPVEKEAIESCTEDKISEKFSLNFLTSSPPPKRFSKASLMVSKSPDNFLAATKIPPPARPANTSPKLTCSPIHLIASANAPAPFSIIVTAPFIKSPNTPSILPVFLKIDEIKSLIASTALPSPSEMVFSDCSMLSL